MFPRRLYAHRGAAAEFPENTIPSFERAVEYGAHALEMDVHASSDGVIVVSHDADGQRMCRESPRIRDTSYNEIRQWDAGWGFVDAAGERPFVGCGYRVPPFAEVLERFPDRIINVDLKQHSPSIVGEILRVVREAGAEERVTIASFSQTTLLHVRLAHYPGITGMGPVELGAAVLAPACLIRPWPLRGLAAQIPVQIRGIALATRRNIDKLHALGARVDFWTINKLQDAKTLLAMGADGIMTDDPKAIAPAFLSY